MTNLEAVARARTAIGQKCAYVLGRGGYSAARPMPDCRLARYDGTYR